MGACALLLLTACGDDGGSDNGVEATPPSLGGEATDPDTGEGSAPETGANAGGGSAVITAGDSTVLFSVTDLTYSQIEGVDDITFETCDASFFGASFHVIGYPVDEAGELILEDDGDLAGIIALTLPLDEAGEAVAGPAEFDLDFSPLEFDLKIASEEQLAQMDVGVESSWVFDANRVSDTVVMANVLSEPTVVDFDISCG